MSESCGEPTCCYGGPCQMSRDAPECASCTHRGVDHIQDRYGEMRTHCYLCPCREYVAPQREEWKP